MCGGDKNMRLSIETLQILNNPVCFLSKTTEDIQCPLLSLIQLLRETIHLKKEPNNLKNHLTVLLVKAVYVPMAHTTRQSNGFNIPHPIVWHA
jgi:hypothetical protein